jgi:hypothetical protein
MLISRKFIAIFIYGRLYEPLPLHRDVSFGLSRKQKVCPWYTNWPFAGAIVLSPVMNQKEWCSWADGDICREFREIVRGGCPRSPRTLRRPLRALGGPHIASNKPRGRWRNGFRRIVLIVAVSWVVLLLCVWGSDLGPDRVLRGFLSSSRQTSG